MLCHNFCLSLACQRNFHLKLIRQDFFALWEIQGSSHVCQLNGWESTENIKIDRGVNDVSLFKFSQVKILLSRISCKMTFCGYWEPSEKFCHQPEFLLISSSTLSILLSQNLFYWQWTRKKATITKLWVCLCGFLHPMREPIGFLDQTD